MKGRCDAADPRCARLARSRGYKLFFGLSTKQIASSAAPQAISWNNNPRLCCAVDRRPRESNKQGVTEVQTAGSLLVFGPSGRAQIRCKPLRFGEVGAGFRARAP